VLSKAAWVTLDVATLRQFLSYAMAWYASTEKSAVVDLADRCIPTCTLPSSQTRSAIRVTLLRHIAKARLAGSVSAQKTSSTLSGSSPPSSLIPLILADRSLHANPMQISLFRIAQT